MRAADGARAQPPQRHLVLLGGGHAHVGVLRSLAMRPEPGLRVTLVSREWAAPYSGMLPGYVAGIYSRDECHIDLAPLAWSAGARLIEGEAIGLDPGAKRLRLRGRPALSYDLLSIDVGVAPRLDGLAGAARFTIPVKPVSQFADRWEAALERLAGSRSIGAKLAVVGGGAAGFELALAAAERLRREGVEGQVSLIASGPPLAAFPARVRSAGARALAKAGVAIVAGDRAVEADAAGLRLSSGRRVAAEAILVAADAQAPAWLTETGLTLDPQGYVAVSETLQGLSHPDVFAAGDCAAISGHPRPKAGVFAVRQGPPLAENLRRAARGAPLTRHRPQRAFLSLLSTADGRAIASRGRWSVEGGWVWRWKDRIDRAFMERHRPEPMAPDAEMRCGGCAAKLGPLSLAGALAVGADEHEAGSFEPEDASLLPTASAQTLRVDTVDFFRAFWPDPYLLGRIAANHAMSDVYAMGGAPKTALAVMVTPEAHPRLAEEDLRQMTAGGRAQLEDAGAALVGGHSSEGAELAAGFAVSGEVAQAGVWRKGGLRAGDRLILTGPIGSGVIFAAAGRGLARGAEVSAALAAMGRPHAPCVQILRAYGATGVTDVTGFGLMGHLLEMLRAAGLTARLDPAAPRLLPGAERLAALGVASSLAPDNLALAEAELAVAPPSVRALLLDPQTAGPLLAGAPGDRAEQCVSALRAIGREAAVIGDVMESALGASDPAPRVQLMSLAAGSQRSGSAKTLSGAS